MSKRSIENRLESLEDTSDDSDELEIVVRESVVDDDGTSEPYRTTRYGYDEQGEWCSEVNQ